VGRTVLLLVGVSLGVLIGIGLFALLDDEPEPVSSPTRPASSSFPPVDHDEQAAAELLAAWERWRTATFFARGSWERRLDSGEPPLRGPVLTVQDPPRRAVVRLGSLVELVDGSVRSCDAELEGTILPGCPTGGSGLSYDARVTQELALVADYVSGDQRPFDVGFGRADNCYRTENRALVPAAPWGLWAEFCFDAETGAMESARVRRQSAVDTEVMVEIRAEVTESDFDFIE
jgi:hypothetical protein